MNPSQLISVLFSINCVHCANILGVFMFPFFSHQTVYQAIWRGLSLKGHNVTVVTTNPLNDHTLTNLTEIDLSYIHEVLEKVRLQHFVSIDSSVFNNLVRSQNFTNFIIEEELQNMDFQKLILDKDRKFDLILIECFMPVLYAFAEKFKAPMISVSSLSAPLPVLDAVGNPNHPVLYPDLLINTHKKKQFFWERVRNTLFNVWCLFHYHNVFIPRNNLNAQKYIGNVSYIGNLEKNISMLYANVNPVLNLLRPNVPAVVEMGQMHLKSVKPLPKDLEKMLDEAEEGVVYFSFGTNVNSTDLVENFRNILTKTMSELPYRVVWKWESDYLSENISNVITRKWLPQQDLLAHPNIRAFVTQGGLQSIEEAILHEVPLVGIPFLIDQPMNVERIVELGIGVGLDAVSLTVDDLKRSIIDVAENRLYKKQIKKIRGILFDKSMEGIDKTIWWCEYVIRHKGAKYLRSPNADMSWFQYLMLDVLLTFMVIVAIPYVIYKILKIFYCLLTFNATLR